MSHPGSAEAQARSMWVGDLVAGPAALAGASLIDLYLVTRVFGSGADPLVGVLAFFVFGASTGVPLHYLFARCSRTPGGAARRRRSGSPAYTRAAAAVAGALAAISTVAWLLCLRVADAAVVFPLANLAVVIFAVVDGAKGHVRVRDALLPLVVLVGGLFVVRPPGLADLAGLTPFAGLLLVIRNVTLAGSEAAERQGCRGSLSAFAAGRFAWLAGVGVPVGVGLALATGRAAASFHVLVEGLPVALPLHAITMLLVYIGTVRRARAKASRSLTVCAAVYATPLVVAPLIAAALNAVAINFFPTIAGSARLTLGAVLVVLGAVWLGSLAPPTQPQPNSSTT